MQDVIESRLVSEDTLFSSDVIYKFHEIGCGDAVWIFSKGNSVEFEEILENPAILEDCVVTQMIHLEYIIDNGRVKISHIVLVRGCGLKDVAEMVRQIKENKPPHS